MGKKRGEPCEGKGKLLRLVAGWSERDLGSATGALARAASEPWRLSGGREGRRDDATSLANGEEAVPAMGSNDAAAVRRKKLGLEVERAKEVASGVRKWKGAGPSNELGCTGSASGGDKLDVAEFHDVVDRVDSETIPLRPPATPGVTEGFVGRVLKEELDMVDAGSSGVEAIGVSGG